MTQRGNTHISYDILSGKVQSINGNQQTFSYHVNGQRLKTQTREAGMQTQILHLNATLNKVTKANGDKLWRHSLRVGNETVSVIEKVGKSKSTQKADRVAFIHRDLQGNSDRVTGLSGQEIRQYMRSNNQAIAALGAEQVIRNPYGRVVHANFVKKQTQGKAQTNSYRSVFAHKSVRDIKADDDEQVKALLLSNEFKLTYQDMIAFSLPGYTGHQEMPSLDLINMNARLYDPVLGRFISADSMVPDATNWDDYNRYMYVRGNPMRYTDPSGHSPKDKDSNSSECTGSSNDSDDCYDSGSSSSSRRDDDDDRSSDSRIKQTPPSSPVGGNEVQANKDQADKELKKKKKHYSQNGEPIDPSKNKSLTSRLWSGVKDVVGKVWNLPNTAVGLVFGGVGHVVGLIMGTNPSIDFGNNAIQFHNNPLIPSAITLGNVIVYGPRTSPNDRNVHFQNTPLGHTVGQEEYRHTMQGQILGPLYLPIHIIGGVSSMFRSPNAGLLHPVDPWHSNNFMETGPMQDRIF